MKVSSTNMTFPLSSIIERYEMLKGISRNMRFVEGIPKKLGGRPPGPGGWGYNDYMDHVFSFTLDRQWDDFLQSYYGAMGLPPESPSDPGTPPVLESPFTVYFPFISAGAE